MLEDMGFNSWQKKQNYLLYKISDQLKQPPKLQLKENHRFIFRITVDKADILTTHICA
jgi:hypothetical protein